jgi:hypothetical protein
VGSELFVPIETDILQSPLNPVLALHQLRAGRKTRSIVAETLDISVSGGVNGTGWEKVKGLEITDGGYDT